MQYPTDPSLNMHPGTGKFTDGDAGAGIPASRDSGEQYNQLWDELLNLITHYGLTPSSADLTQVLQAVQAAAGRQGATVMRSAFLQRDTWGVTVDPELSGVELRAGKYLVRAVLFVHGVQNVDVSPGIQFTFSPSVSATSNQGVMIVQENGGPMQREILSSLLNQNEFLNDLNLARIEITNELDLSADGTVDFLWAPRNNSADPLNMYSGSWISYTPVG